MEKTDIVIIGAGVVGLSVASSLSGAGRDVLLVERHSSFGCEASSRNSEVIHASVYYPRNSLKGRLCLEGNRMMYKLCAEKNIPFLNCGKLIVAVDEEEEAALPGLLETARSNGAEGVRLIGGSEIHSIEPKVRARAAIRCPSSGVVDSHRLMQYFEANAITNGADVVYGMEVFEIEKNAAGFAIAVRDAEGDEYKISTRILVNCAGLGSGDVAELAGIDIDGAGYRINYHKGIYFRVSRNLEKYPKALIYPIPPEPGSVGIHTCPDLGGGMRLGPHFFWTDALDYSLDDTFKEYFFESAGKYLPFLELDDLNADSSGIMSAIQKPGEDMKDFVIRHEADRGLPGLINLVGIESPGLTASPAIGSMLKEIVDEISK